MGERITTLFRRVLVAGIEYFFRRVSVSRIHVHVRVHCIIQRFLLGWLQLTHIGRAIQWLLFHAAWHVRASASLTERCFCIRDTVVSFRATLPLASISDTWCLYSKWCFCHRGIFRRSALPRCRLLLHDVCQPAECGNVFICTARIAFVSFYFVETTILEVLIISSKSVFESL